MPPLAVATAAVAMDGIDPEVLRFVVVLLVGLVLGALLSYALLYRRLTRSEHLARVLWDRLHPAVIVCTPVEVSE